MSNRIITVSREFGSGGRELGKRLAEAMEIPYYDKEIIAAIADRSGLALSYVEQNIGKGFQPYPIHYGRTFSLYGVGQDNQTKMLIAQQQILQELAEKGDCLIVGRCADMVLEEYNPFSIFVYASLESKMKRCREKAFPGENLTDRELKKKISQVDSGRMQYRRLLSDKKWGDKEAYSLCVNTSNMTIKNLIPSLSSYADCWFKEKQQ